jgi:hypothetical protein
MIPRIDGFPALPVTIRTGNCRTIRRITIPDAVNAIYQKQALGERRRKRRRNAPSPVQTV